ncbi:MAG: hexose kinase [Candidatus Omnitrophica bacterium]|nr:hexose kinase [Candidatus Omnitrophota bacterium]
MVQENNTGASDGGSGLSPALKRDLERHSVSLEIRNLLSLSMPDAVEALGNLFLRVASTEELGVRAIPAAYELVSKNLPPDRLRTLNRISFNLFAGSTPEEFASELERETSSSPEKNETPLTERSNIYTLTPNTALDVRSDIKTVLDRDQGSRDGTIIHAGGKGVNVSVGLRQWGISSMALGFIGGTVGKIHAALMERQGISASSMIVGNENTRINLSIHAGGKNLVHFMSPGTAISDPEREAAEKLMFEELKRGDSILLGGSLPPGLSEDYYGELIIKLKERGVKTFVDTRGAALSHAINARPYFVGINAEEFASYFGIDPDNFKRDPKNVASYTAQLVREGTELVVISCGARGMIMASKDGVFWAHPPKVDAVSIVGAGDTIKVAFAYTESMGGNPLDALKLATAASAVTVTKEGTGISTLEEALAKKDQVIIEKIGDRAEISPREES